MTRRTTGDADSSKPSTDLSNMSLAGPSSGLVDILILGAGWSSTFLIPILKNKDISHAATTTSGRGGTIPFKFDPDSADLKAYRALPTAKTVLITFPLTGEGQSKKLVDLYARSRKRGKGGKGGKEGKEADADILEDDPFTSNQNSSSTTNNTNDTNTNTNQEDDHDHDLSAGGRPNKTLFIQLGSTGIFTAPHWNTHKSSYNKENPRAQAEDELLSLSKGKDSQVLSTVLNLAGLYGGQRDPKTWLPRVIKAKEDIKEKKALHLVHGRDVARAILAAHRNPRKVARQRWIITDLHVYDWWDLIYEWSGQTPSTPEEMELFDCPISASLGSVATTAAAADKDGKEKDGKGGKDKDGKDKDGKGKDGEDKDPKEPEKTKIVLKKAVLEYMLEADVRALPRGPAALGRVLDARDFWQTVGWWPGVGRVK